jgi:hypothetical protein
VTAVVGALFFVPASIGTAYAARFVFYNIRQMPILGRLWMAAALFFTLAILLGACSERTATRRFSREGQTTDGTVIETHPEDHDRLLVAYSISGVDYRVRSQGPQVARSYSKGERIPVYYYASAPQAGFCVQPRWRPDITVAWWVLAACVIPLWMVALFGSCTDVKTYFTKRTS